MADLITDTTSVNVITQAGWQFGPSIDTESASGPFRLLFPSEIPTIGDRQHEELLEESLGRYGNIWTELGRR